MRIYMCQYGGIWSFTIADAIRLAEHAITEPAEGWNFGDFGGKQLKREHRAYKREDGSGRALYPWKPRHYQPLDWEKYDWEIFLEEIKSLQNQPLKP